MVRAPFCISPPPQVFMNGPLLASILIRCKEIETRVTQCPSGGHSHCDLYTMRECNLLKSTLNTDLPPGVLNFLFGIGVWPEGPQMGA